MEISHNDAIDLENLVRKVHNCERFGMGMYIDADHFETNPFDAALRFLRYGKLCQKKLLRTFYIVGIVHYEKKMMQILISLLKN